MSSAADDLTSRGGFAMRMATQPEAGGTPTWGEAVATRARSVADVIARAIAFPGVTPNVLTVVGFFLTGLVALVIGSGYELIGGVLVILVSLFDMLDGAMARVSKSKTRFGAFLDSTLDRCSEAVLLGGVLWLYMEPLNAMLVLWALAGSLLVSYTRARAEGLMGEIGILQRPQRVVLLSAGLITGLVVPALWLMAVFSTVTTVQRILFVRRALGNR
jgi:CDP-diacylglycerol--glycerol-3-phosphate 3-phosphatidyltransferase